jgi:sortase A
MRLALRSLSTVLIVAGVLLLADAAMTLAWQEPVSALWARMTQNRLSGDLERLERAGVTPLERRALSGLDERRRIAYLARALRSRVEEGQAIGRIDMPSVGAHFVVVDGTAPADLHKGPGLYREAAFPGTSGTTAIAGHRTTYLAPFRHIDRLRRGDRVTLTTPYARFTYAVQGQRVVEPTEVRVIRRVGYDRLVLSACHPLYSAARRIVVFARLVGTEPRGAAA